MSVKGRLFSKFFDQGGQKPILAKTCLAAFRANKGTGGAASILGREAINDHRHYQALRDALANNLPLPRVVFKTKKERGAYGIIAGVWFFDIHGNTVPDRLKPDFFPGRQRIFQTEPLIVPYSPPAGGSGKRNVVKTTLALGKRP